MILLGQGEHLKMKFLTLLCNFFHFITLSFTVLRAGLELSLLPSTSDNIYITFHYTNFLWLPLDNCNQLVMTWPDTNTAHHSQPDAEKMRDSLASSECEIEGGLCVCVFSCRGGYIAKWT